MKIIAFFLLSLLTVNAVCVELRLSDIRPGVSCDAIPEIEKSLGSLEISAHDANGISKYTGIHGNKKAIMVYQCANGRLTEQKIIVTVTSRDEAYQFADEQKIELIKHLGDPIHDGFALGTWKRLFFAFAGADLDYLSVVVVWGRAKEDVMLSVKELGTNLWEVSISRGTSKMEYILNS